jgi:hypothetical protein
VTRLESISPRLAKRLLEASPQQLRSAARAAAEFARERIGEPSDAVTAAWERLRDRNELSPGERWELESALSTLDCQYLDLMDRFEADAAEPLLNAARAKFANARAVATLLAAFADDAFEAASEATYEASMITDEHRAVLFARIESTL